MQDGRIKAGDRITAVGDEPVAGLSVDKVDTHTHIKYSRQGQVDLMIYDRHVCFLFRCPV